MNIALIGYGKMGKEIHHVANQRGHFIVKIIDYTNKMEMIEILNSEINIDVVIEFTKPSDARINTSNCLRSGIPIVCGTTGWHEELKEIKALSHELGVGFLHASNFSVGMNIVFAINKLLAKMINTTNSYKAKITEIHHTQKLDMPSGTAITLAEQLVHTIDNIYDWSLTNKSEGLLPIESFRKENIPGIHKINYQSAFDEIELSHSAKNRKGFALGAVIAAEFLINKKGVFEMRDVMESLLNNAFIQA